MMQKNDTKSGPKHHAITESVPSNETGALSSARIDETPPQDDITRAEPLKRVRFIPYPYNTLGSGTDMQCRWETKSLDNNNSTAYKYDFIQRAAFAEGVCIPSHLNASLHVFSSADAKKCLSQSNITLVMSGDSYTKQLYIGLADILTGKYVFRGKEIIGGSERNTVLENVQRLLAKCRKNSQSLFPDVQFVCVKQCYGYEQYAPFSRVCAKCINSIIKRHGNNNAVAVVGAGVHIKAQFKDSSNSTSMLYESTVQEIGNFLHQVNNTIFVSTPSYQREKIPVEHQESNLQMGGIYGELLRDVAPRNPEHPFLDVFQLTQSCFMENCSYDGGHRSRYVNRWKAQLLLNMLCEIQQE